MPLYEYRCGACGVDYEALVARSSDPAPPCPGCGAAEARRQLSVFAVSGSPRPEAGPCGGGECACRAKWD